MVSGKVHYTDVFGYVRDVEVGEAFAEQLGFRLKIARLAAGLTQREVGERVGLSREAISRYETGRSQPDVVMLLRLARLLGVGVTELLPL